MKKLLLIALPLTLMLTVQAQSEDEKAIQKVVIDFEKSFNAKDAKETAAYWAEDGEFVTYQGKLRTLGDQGHAQYKFTGLTTAANTHNTGLGQYGHLKKLRTIYL